MILGCANPFEASVDESESGTEEDVFADGTGNQTVADLMLDGWKPGTGSPLLGSGRAPADAWFDDVDFVGGIGAEDWTAGWTVDSTD